jgi:hypothetical protein
MLDVFLETIFNEHGLPSATFIWPSKEQCQLYRPTAVTLKTLRFFNRPRFRDSNHNQNIYEVHQYNETNRMNVYSTY